MIGYRILRRKKYSFRNKVVFVTGGSRGLGLILARQLGREGAKLFLCARGAQQLKKTRQELERAGVTVAALACDISHRDQVERAVQSCEEQLGPIDVLVNNASIMLVGPWEDLSDEDFKSAVDVNFWGGYHCLRAVVDKMKARRQGRILNVTSLGGVLGIPHLLPYCSGKFAFVGLSEGLAAEVAPYGVRVTTVVPGLMRTGSYLNALFKGQRAAEFTWFSLGASLPLISMDAERAARAMIEACREGRYHLTLGLPAKLGRIIHGVFPGLVVATLALSARLLPESRGRDEKLMPPEPGDHYPEAPSRRGFLRVLTVLGERSARRFGETKPAA